MKTLKLQKSIKIVKEKRKIKKHLTKLEKLDYKTKTEEGGHSNMTNNSSNIKKNTLRKKGLWLGMPSKRFYIAKTLEMLYLRDFRINL